MAKTRAGVGRIPSGAKVVIMSFADVVNPVVLEIDFLITIDTTPSMQSVQSLARQNAKELVRDLKTTFPNCRIGVIFNGDLYDEPGFDRNGKYTVATLQPTDNLQEIVRFIKETPSTNLARGNAAYAEVLWQANNNIRWRKGARRMMIMIGDTSPDQRYDYTAVDKRYLDAYAELDKAVRNGIKITAIHCPTGTMDYRFWKALPERSGGYYLDLYQFHEALEAITAAALNEGGSDLLVAFEKFLRENNRYSRGVDFVVSTLLGRKTTIKKGGLTPVDPHRFQLLTITDDDCDPDGKVAIKQYVEDQGYKFEKGRGFYELVRAETIQDYKEIVVMERDTGDMYTGEDNIRRLLNIPLGTSKVRLRDVQNIDKYRIFVQSASVNRRLIEGALFLYNIENLRTN